MSNRLLVGLALSMLLTGSAEAACPTFPYSFTNGSTADANQINGNFANVATCFAPLNGPAFTGNVGIGTVSPHNTLDLESTTQYTGLNVGNGSSVIGQIVGLSSTNDNGGLILFNAGTKNVQIVASGNTFIDGGNVGIGTASPTYPLYVNGTAYATGAAGALSDIRHKDKVTTLAPGALAIVEKLRPVTFVWKDPKDDGMKGEQIGFIAQEVVKLLPSVVLTDTDADKTLGIKYTEIIPVLTKAIQEQQAEIDALQRQVAALKSGK